MSDQLTRTLKLGFSLATYATAAALISSVLILTDGPGWLAIALIMSIGGVGLFFGYTAWLHIKQFRDNQHLLQQNLIESHKRFDDIAEHINSGIILTDADGVIKYANPYVTILTGYTTQEMIGKAPADVFILPERSDAMRRHMQQRLKGHSDTYEICVTPKVGADVWLQVYAAPIYNQAGDIDGTIGIINNITDKKQMIETLRHSAYELQSIINHMPVIFAHIADDGTLLRLEGRALADIGLLSGEMVGQSIYEVFEGHPHILDEIRESLNGNTHHKINLMHNVFFESYYIPLIDDDNQTNGILMVSINISDRFKLQKDLELRTHAIEYSTSGISIADATHPETPLIYVNQAMMDITGYTRDDMIGRNCRFLQGSDRKQPQVEILKQAIHNGTSCTVMLRNYRKNGEMFYNELSISPIFDADGTITHFIGIANDVTERKNAEQSIADAHEEALEASRLKTEFLATMSHEIRTPMNGIIGMTELLMDTPLDDEQHEFAQIAYTEAYNLLKIINDILDYAKIEAGKLALDNHPFSLHELVDGIIASFAPECQKKHIRIMSEIEPSLPRVLHGDTGRLQQVLTSLMSNAVKFTQEGEIVLRVIPDTQHDSGACMLHFAVLDTGIGLNKHARKLLFQPFTQVDGSTTRKYGGTGLGLAISKRLIALMGGEVGVESVEGVGSTFWFTAQFDVPHAAPQPEYHQDFAEMHVLLVEPNQTQRDILRRTLTYWQADCTPVDSAQAAQRALQTQTFDCVIITHTPPELDGVALANRLHSAPPMILMAAPESATGNQHAKTIITLPLKQAHLERALENIQYHPNIGNTSPIPHITRHNNHWARILLVEDNEANRDVASKQLERLHCVVLVAQNGVEALDILANNPQPIDLVLMDCQMPAMDGFEAAQRIRKQESASGTHVPIVAMTANALKGDRERCIAVGMDDYISKPVTIKQLEDVLKRWLTATVE